MLVSIFCTIILYSTSHCSNPIYNVTVIEMNSHPIASYIDTNSKFQQVYNPAVAVSSPTLNTPGLLIRTRNCTLPIGNCTHSPCQGTGSNASILTFVNCDMNNGQCSNSNTNPIDQNNIVFGPTSIIDELGTEDPRLIYNSKDGHYYLFYTSYGYTNQSSSNKKILLSVAKTKYPNRNDSWTRYGPILNTSPSKSGAVILSTNTDPLNYLYWFGSPCIYITNSTQLTKWPNMSEKFICPRVDMFDQHLTESGPPPIQLWDNNYLFLYNSDTNNWPKNPNSSYNVGFVIIDVKNKSNVLQRSDTPFLSPTMSWEIGESPYTCNHHNVVFVEGAYKLNQTQKMEYVQKRNFFGENVKNVSEMDIIRIFFGGSDAVTGTAVIQVSYQ